MTKEDFATLINGRQYRNELTKEEEKHDYRDWETDRKSVV